jgi:hypothetical protein
LAKWASHVGVDFSKKKKRGGGEFLQPATTVKLWMSVYFTTVNNKGMILVYMFIELRLLGRQRCMS